MAAMGEKDLASIALVRRLYEVFRGPDAAGVAELCAGNWVSDVEETLAVLGLARPATWHSLLQQLGTGCHNREQMLEELSVEHTRLFVNAYGGTPAPPYASVYLNDLPMLGGQVTLQVIEWYKRAGVALPPDYPEPPDYLPVELEFVIHLIQSIPEAGTGQAASQLRQVQREFWQDHFSLWIPQFVARTTEESQHPLYTASAEILGAFVQQRAVLV